MPALKRTCANCTKEFSGPINSYFCSNACKQQAYRKRKRSERMLFSEAEILKLVETHHPIAVQTDGGTLCSCNYKEPVIYSSDHLIDKLKENQDG